MSDDEDELDSCFAFLKSGVSINIENEESDSKPHLVELERAFVHGNIAYLKDYFSKKNNEIDIILYVQLAINILDGSFINAITSEDNLMSLCQSFLISCESHQDIRIKLLSAYNLSENKEVFCFHLYLIGRLFLDIYMQENYTGPEYNPHEIHTIMKTTNETVIDTSFKYAIQQLECDGEYPYPICHLPQLLYVSRCILTLIADALRGIWKQGIIIDKNGNIQKSIILPPNSTTDKHTDNNNYSSNISNENMDKNDNNSSNISESNEQRQDIADNDNKYTITTEHYLQLQHFSKSCRWIQSKEWMAARCSLIHLRLLQKQSYESIPTLWKECYDYYTIATTIYGKRMRYIESYPQALLYLSQYNATTTTTNIHNTAQSSNNNTFKNSDHTQPLANISTNTTITNTPTTTTTSTSTTTTAAAAAAAVSKSTCIEYSDIMIESMLWLEWGLCQHFFQYKNKGKVCFLRAQCAAGLYTTLTASPGKRSKYQREHIAQLYLYAQSHLLLTTSSSSSSSSSSQQTSSHHESNKGISDTDNHTYNTNNALENSAGNTENTTAAATTTTTTTTTMGEEEESYSKDYLKEYKASEWELGRKLIRENDHGEEAALREIKLDDVEGGAAENIIIEGGPKFANEVNTGGLLHSIDQTVILGLCLDVSNSNPVDGLTNEEMLPYIERVLAQHTNWMIHSTALLQRSWLEFERRKTADRALLQMQALLDQHTTRLTITQSTYQSIETSAKNYERLQYIYCLSYPAQYEFKKDLAQKYLGYSVFSSALNLFKELELWDEVVTCYQLMDKPHRAELVVREQLKKGATPYMLTSLGDLTGNEDFYEQAWILSKHRYARAKRTLARIYYDKKDFTTCVYHMDLALSVQPFVPKSWYIQGIAYMHLKKWEKALESFTRCVQQDMEIGEGWANMGSIYMEMKEYYKAYVSFIEALKQKRNNWKIIENLFFCCLEIEKWSEAILYVNMLLDQYTSIQAHSQHTPIHIPELRRLVASIITSAAKKSKDSTITITTPTTSATTTSTNSTEMDKGSITEEKVQNEQNQQNQQEERQEATQYYNTMLLNKLETLLIRITQVIDSDPNVWDIIAVYYNCTNRLNDAKESRVKQYRALMTKPEWEKDTGLINAIIQATEKLISSYQALPALSKADIYTCNSLIQSVLKKLHERDTAHWTHINNLYIAFQSWINNHTTTV